MDPTFRETLMQGAARLGIPVTPGAGDLLERYADRLLVWNRKVNLTAITAPAAVAEKHILDSLLVAGSMGGARSLLDIGTGAGLPGVPLACLRPELEVVCCDSISKKVAFVKAVSADLGLRGVRGLVLRAAGEPGREGLSLAEAVVSRAVADPEVWVPLGAPYVAPGGALLAMLGRLDDEEKLRVLGAASGLRLDHVARYELPFSGAARAIVRWVRG